MYRVDVTPVVGLPQFDGWSQVATSQFADQHLVCAFSIQGDHAGNVGRDLTTIVAQSQVKDSATLHQFINNLMTEVEQMGAQLQLAVGVFSQTRSILGVFNGSVFLKRYDRTGVLLKSDSDIKLIEGQRFENDVVLLSTAQSSNFLKEVELKFKSGFDLDSVVTSIIPGLHGQANSSLSSIAFIAGGQVVDISQAETQKQPEPIEETVKTLPPIQIPPALKLRGAGKKRQEQSEVLQKLGQTSQASSRIDHPQTLVKINTLLVTVSGKLSNKLKQIDWAGFKTKLMQFLTRLKIFIKKLWLKIKLIYRRLVSQDVYLKQKSKRELLRLFLPWVVGLIVISSLIGFLINRSRVQIQAVNDILEPLQAELVIAQDLAKSDPLLARQKLDNLLIELTQLKTDYDGQRRPQKLILAQLAAAQTLYEQVSGQVELSQLEIFFDLRLVDNEFLATLVDADAQQAVFIDQARAQLLILDLTNKKTQIQDLSALPEVKDFELKQASAMVLAEGVKQISLSETSSPAAQLIDEGDSNRDGIFLEKFATYIYIFNPSKRNIYRYAQRETGFSEPIGWLSGAASFDYGQVSSWAIDGDIWLTTREGGLYQLTAGEETDFAPSGLDQPFVENLIVFTNDELKNLYVLEPNQQRLVILTKEGELVKEITSPSLAATTSLFASETLGQVFAVSGSIIYSMPI